MREVFLQILKNETLVGLIIGAFLTAGYTWLLDSLKFRREEKIYYKRKKEEVYLEMQSILTAYQAQIQYLKGTKKLPIDLRKKLNNIRGKAKMYSSEDASKSFYKLIDGYMDSILNDSQVSVDEWHDFSNKIKKELDT